MKPGMQIMPAPSMTCAFGASTFAADRDDGAVAHVHVADCEIAELRVHGQHVGAADDELAARRQFRGRALGRTHRRLLREQRVGRERRTTK